MKLTLDQLARVRARDPDRRLVGRRHEPCDPFKPSLHLIVNVDRDREIDVLGDDERRRHVGLQKVRYLGAGHEHAANLEDRLHGAQRLQ